MSEYDHSHAKEDRRNLPDDEYGHSLAKEDARNATLEEPAPVRREIALLLSPTEAELLRRAVEHYKNAAEYIYVEASVQKAGALDWNRLGHICTDLSWRIAEATRRSGVGGD